MKAVCSKHIQAYDVGVGCPWCEPTLERAAEPEPRPVGLGGAVALHENVAPSSFCSRAEPPASTPVLPPQGFDTRKLTVDDMMRLSRFYAL